MKCLRIIFCLLGVFLANVSCAQSNGNIKNNIEMKYNNLTTEEEAVIINKGTEYPYTGEYVNNKKEGVYVCKRCNTPLYNSSDKFDSQCGWPSFEDEILGAVKRVPDADGMRTEIICATCGGHLGHVFWGEGFTTKNTRHCVNSISLKFIPSTDKAVKITYFASGCFWGTEYFFMKASGVRYTVVGYMGGHVKNPSYEQVCEKNTGHLETTQVEYDSNKTSYDDLVKLFFETHDFTQTNGQGPDIGPQYLSCIFYSDEAEKKVAQKYIDILTAKGYIVATMLKPVSEFWKAENYHQQYYEHKGAKPYCHSYKKIF